MLHGDRLYITRDQAIFAIRQVEPDGQLIGITTKLLVLFTDIRWVAYLPPEHLWDLTFGDEVSALMWRLTYI
ncbi:MAG: hypothetical protein DI537_45305 [Stutzerimonas stutzeri]|nr:MAG: hypothetical protein DI537_45305 [Stutzerimonas stutzeri]